ncbi:Ig-like domain-containing protein [Reichenbachiella sp.]|uniref:Ig-like domain-containing protein n=1 Tax=Reichenbachiella sp. TaxID=2184521 RepID=UPI003BAF7B54
MKKTFTHVIMALLVLTIVSCKDDLPAGEGIPQIYVTGATTALPTAVEEYSVGDAGSATWTVSDAAVASVSGSGSTANVTFLSPGDVRVTATIGSESGYVDVRVSAIGVGVTVTTSSYGVIREDSTGTATFTFDAPLAKAPTFTLDSATLANGRIDSVGTIEGGDDKYTLFFRGGAGDGANTGYLKGIEVAANFGGETADSVAVSVFNVDNTLALIADVESPTSNFVNWGSDASVKVTFSEAMRPKMSDAADTAVWIHWDYTLNFAAKDSAVHDSIVMVSEDMLSWTMNFTIPDSIDDGGVISFDKIVGEFLDLAGNETVNDIVSPGDLTIDRDGPTTTADQVIETANARTDGSDAWLRFGAFATDGGIGVTGIESNFYYYIREYGSDTTATGDPVLGPTKLADFSSEPMTSYSGAVDMDLLMSTDSASYDIFWIAVDALGNAGTVDSTGFHYDKDGNFAIGHN